ncbi:MAG: methyltransferase domain-containing protein [Catenulisporales bacterium]|jgi:SAM-dependent methyltransferase|nr:methyltransferase domain-containing protein [Catenulisporales bacterium]
MPAANTLTGAWTSSAPYAQALSDPQRPLTLRTSTGRTLRLDAARFTAPPDAVDHAVLDRCHSPTLDLGCGPGRLVAELARRGVPALGIDVAPAAVLLGRAAGAAVLQRSVFDRLPGAGRWPHALLMDGNIGIGGDPAALLARIRALIQPGIGELVVETESEDIHENHVVTFEGGGMPFGWTRIGAEALVEVAAPLGFRVADRWTAGGRRFVALVTCLPGT